MKSSMSIWHYVANVNSTVKISSIFVAFLENMNFNVNERRFQFITEVTRQTKDELSQKEKGKSTQKFPFLSLFRIGWKLHSCSEQWITNRTCNIFQ